MKVDVLKWVEEEVKRIALEADSIKKSFLPLLKKAVPVKALPFGKCWDI